MKKIFISHASADEQVVSLFVNKILKAGCDVKTEDIIYTSQVDTGVVNGDDIPETIKKGIRESALFFMMVSDNYRKSEVCLNEMGAAWITDGLVRKIMILPGAGFDQIGWLMSLKKGTKLDDRDGLDMIHDEVIRVLGSPLHTATWNRSRNEFLTVLADTKDKMSPAIQEKRACITIEEIDEDLDLLDIRERFDANASATNDVLNILLKDSLDYGVTINHMINGLNILQATPTGYSAAQVRGILQGGAISTNRLAESYEQQASLLRNYFDRAIKYAIMMQQSNTDPEVKKGNRESVKGLIDNMIDAKDQFVSFQESIDLKVNLDKGYKSASTRLKKALGELLDAISFCITRAGELRMV